MQWFKPRFSRTLSPTGRSFVEMTPFKNVSHGKTPLLDLIHNHHQSKYQTSGFGFPKTFHHKSELNGPHLWSKAQGRQGLTQVFLQQAKTLAFQRRFQTWMPNTKHFMAKRMLLRWEFCIDIWILCSRVVRTSQRLTNMTLIGYCTCSAHWTEPESGD